MAARYCGDPRTIILCVLPANADMTTSDGLQMARELDPKGIRTIGVITKIDIMDKGTNAKRMLEGKDVQLRLGFIGIKNRSQQDIMDRISVNPSLSCTSFPSSILLALVPLSIISIFVITPIVLIPFGSSSLAICKPSEVVISALAGRTQRMIVRGSPQYLAAMFFVTFSISGSYPAIGILVIPGKSTMVRSGHVCEKILRTIGLSIMFFYCPQILSVKKLIVSLTS
jgi:hypothetical protein